MSEIDDLRISSGELGKRADIFILISLAGRNVNNGIISYKQNPILGAIKT